MKKKIYLYMCGGLGNQLFQYATAKNLALQNNRELYVDYITGFWTDFRDFRKFELNKKKLIQCKLKFIVIILTILLKICHHINVFFGYIVNIIVFLCNFVLDFFFFRGIFDMVCISEYSSDNISFKKL